jgi:hypothetical protein
MAARLWRRRPGGRRRLPVRAGPGAGLSGDSAGRGAGCAAATTPDSTTSGQDRTSPPRPATPRCHTADLALEVGQDDSGTGHTGLNLALVNRSAHRCRIYGYGGVQLLDATGAAVHTLQERSGPRPELVTLRPGDRAYSALTWIFSPEAPPCSIAAFLQVIPPDETEPIRARFAYGICGNGVLSQRAYQPDPT